MSIEFVNFSEKSIIIMKNGYSVGKFSYAPKLKKWHTVIYFNKNTGDDGDDYIAIGKKLNELNGVGNE